MAVQAILDSLEAYTGELESLNAFTQTAARELGADWTDKIYDALGELSDYQKEKLDHAFNYYAATTAWNEIQGYLTHDGPLNYQETVERLPILEHWLAFFGAAGEEVVSSLKSRLKLEGAAAARDTSALDDPFATVPVTSGQSQNNTVVSDSVNVSAAGQIAAQSEIVQAQEDQVSEAQIPSEPQRVVDAEFEAVPVEAIQSEPMAQGQKGVFLNEELNTARMQERINDIFSDESSFEKTHKIAEADADVTPEGQTVEPSPILDERPDALSKRAVDGDVLPEQVREALEETAERETNTIFEESDLNDFFHAAAQTSQQTVQASQQVSRQDTLKGRIIETVEDETASNMPQNSEIPARVSQNARMSEQNTAASDESLNEFFAASVASEDTADTDDGQGSGAMPQHEERGPDVTLDNSFAENKMSSSAASIQTDAEANDTGAIAAAGMAAGAAIGRAMGDDASMQPIRPQRQPVTQDVGSLSNEQSSQVAAPIQAAAAPMQIREARTSDTPQNVSVKQAQQAEIREQIRLTPESEEEFKVNRVFRQIDFKSAVQAWISARCIELGYTNNYTYRYYGFLVDVMDRTIEEINGILADETLYDFVEQRRQGGIHFLQNQLIALEKESKDAHDRITADLSPLPREGLSTDDVRKALGQMDLSGEKEYLGPAPDGFEMLEDPYQSLDEATVKKEYAKIEAEADLPPAEPVKPVEPSELKKPMVSIKSASQTQQNGVQRKMSFSFGKKTTPAGSNNS